MQNLIVSQLQIEARKNNVRSQQARSRTPDVNSSNLYQLNIYKKEQSPKISVTNINVQDSAHTMDKNLYGYKTNNAQLHSQLLDQYKQYETTVNQISDFHSIKVKSQIPKNNQQKYTKFITYSNYEDAKIPELCEKTTGIQRNKKENKNPTPEQQFNKNNIKFDQLWTFKKNHLFLKKYEYKVEQTYKVNEQRQANSLNLDK